MIIRETLDREFFFLPTVRYLKTKTYNIIDFMCLKWRVAIVWRRESEDKE